jgi:hypothetical protein
LFFFVQGPVVFIIYLQGASATRFPACQRFMPSSAAVVLRKKNRDENDVGGQIAAPQRTGDSLRAEKKKRVWSKKSLPPLESGVRVLATIASTRSSSLCEAYEVPLHANWVVGPTALADSTYCSMLLNYQLWRPDFQRTDEARCRLKRISWSQPSTPVMTGVGEDSSV